MKILVVDEDTQSLDRLVEHLQFQWRDATVVSAADGEAGIQVFLEEIPDLVILSVTLRGKGGFEVLREIRRQSAGVPVILLTNRRDEAEEVKGLEMEADAYLAKPFGSMAFLARVKAVLRRAMVPTGTEGGSGQRLSRQPDPNGAA